MQDYQALKRGSGWWSSPTRWPSPPGSPWRSRRSPPRSGRVPGGAAGRVPGHLGRPGDHAARAVLRRDPERRTRPPGDRGGRSVPGDLRLAGGGGEQHPDLRREFPTARTAGRRPASPSPSTGAAGSTILDVANGLSAPLRGEAPSTAGSGRAPGVGTGRGGAAGGARRRRRPGRSAPRPSTPGPRRSAGSATRWSRSGRPARRRAGPTSPC